MIDYIKYPRTEHTLLSKTTDLLFKADRCFPLVEKTNDAYEIVIEEKMDGIGLGIGFSEGIPYVQQRGHIYLIEDLPHYLHSFKQWIIDNEISLYEIIEERYVMFGEWLYYKHSVFYDALPDYFLEYDVYDKNQAVFLSTEPRKKFIADNKSWLNSVHVIEQRISFTSNDLENILRQHPHSVFKTKNLAENFENIYRHHNQYELLRKATLLDKGYEGFYIKIEDRNCVVARYKYIRKSFIELIKNGEHWRNSPLITNQLL